jgi:hypothetical protein
VADGTQGGKSGELMPAGADLKRPPMREGEVSSGILHRHHASKRQPSRQEWMNVPITPLRGQTLEALRRHEAALPLPDACTIVVSSATAARSGCSARP